MIPSSSHCGRFESITDRRDFLAKAGGGLGLLGLADLLGAQHLLADDDPERQSP